MEWYLTARSRKEIEKIAVRLARERNATFADLDDLLHQTLKLKKIPTGHRNVMLTLLRTKREEILKKYYTRAKKEFFKKRLASSQRNA